MSSPDLAGVAMQRRAFITLFAGAAVARPLTAGAQLTERMRRIGVLMSVAADGLEDRRARRRLCRG
jgi:hypothetical protein